MADLAFEFASLVKATAPDRFEAAVRASLLGAAEVRRHPLNFLAARIEDGEGRAIRLHLWDHRFRFGQPGFEIHDHSFDLESAVIAGEVAQRTFELVKSDQGELRPFEVSYLEGGSFLTPSGGPVALRETALETFAAGQSYRLPHGVLHRLDLISEAAITLVLTNNRSGPPTTIGPADGAATCAAERTVVRDADGIPATLDKYSFAQIVALALG